PLIPGHEVVGRIEAIAADVSGWSVGQRVGVGFLGGHCGRCEPCRRGDFVNCRDQPFTGMTRDGGYAEMMTARMTGLVAIPDGFDAIDAAPLLCAGITTFNALRRSQARAGELVAIHGIGGLGHLGVQYARRMGFRVAAISRGEDKRALATKLGAHHYIDSDRENAAAALQALGGAKAILATVSSPSAMSPLVDGLAPHGELLVAGAGQEPLSVSTLGLIFGERSVRGTMVGTSIETEDMLGFSLLQKISAMIETFPLEEGQRGFDRMMRNEARFRVVLTMD
ncbi:MAG: alcohol dehydrogenase, partial [Rhodospirillaceae bacterium]